MKNQDYLMLFLVVGGGTFLALAVWSYIVKQQLQSQLAANPAATTLAGLLSKV